MPGACFFLTRGHWCSRPNRFRAILPGRCPSRFTLPCSVRGYDEDGFVCPLEDGKGMRFLRYSAPLFILCAVLAACGGGGGGGGVTPPGGGGGGGGGGGSTPSPSPTHSGSPAPTSSPTVSPTSQPSSTPVPVSSQVLNGFENYVNGGLWYTSGVSANWANTAGYDKESVFTGNPQDNMNCTQVQEGQGYPPTAFSQHMFVGFLVNGTEEALPQALGMVQPVAPTQGNPQHPNNFWEVENNLCEYNVHTHDYSGLVHIEDIGLPQNESYTYAPGYASLQTLLDEWQATLTGNSLTADTSTLNGNVAIYVGVPTGQMNGNDLVNSYTQVNATPANIALARHNVIWIVFGTFPSAGLPQVQFGVEN